MKWLKRYIPTNTVYSVDDEDNTTAVAVSRSPEFYMTNTNERSDTRSEMSQRLTNEVVDRS